MENAQRKIEERKKALSKYKPQNDISVVESPFLRSHEPLALAGSMYSHGLLSKNDSDMARKIAGFQATIPSPIRNVLKNVSPTDRPKPLILNEYGKTVDLTGKEVLLTKLAPTLKANIRAKKREEFKAQSQDSKGLEEFLETNFFDSRIGVKSSIRNKRTLKLNEPGKFIQIAKRIRSKAQLEKLQNEISQIARKTGISSVTKLALIGSKSEALNNDIPNVEWWDSVILSGNPSEFEDFTIKVSAITNLVEHPVQMRPFGNF